MNDTCIYLKDMLFHLKRSMACHTIGYEIKPDNGN